MIYPCAKSPCIQQFFPVCRLQSVKRCELKVCCTSIACLLYKELYKKYERSSKSHCLFTTFRADVKSVPHPLYSSFVVLWGLLWNLKNNPQFAMCICITHLEMNTGLVSSLNLTNKLAPHFSHFFLCGNFQRKQDVQRNFVSKICLSLITGKPEMKEN